MHPQPFYRSSALWTVRDDQAPQLCLCDALEVIVDDLPSVNSALVQRTIDALDGGLLADIARRQEFAFNALLQTGASDRALGLVARRLLDEQAHDTYAVDELIDALRALVRQERAGNPEMTGYLLRGFFEARRRHIAWQTEVLVPLAYELGATSSSDRAANYCGTHSRTGA